MTLQKWCIRERVDDKELAKRVGRRTHRATISKLRRRKSRANLALALAIERATGGEVKAEELPLSAETRADLAALRGEGAAA
jgi:DNA-binding transcriptional regulator YdaS (Cro superfamily)